MVRLRREIGEIFERNGEISIPHGTIKTNLNLIVEHLSEISIPHGTIKTFASIM